MSRLSARTLTQLAVAVLAVLALALAGILVARTFSSSASAAASGPDGGTCDLTAMPSPLSPKTEDSVLLVSADKGVTVTVDGKTVVSLADDPQSLPVGEHHVRVTCPGKPPLEQSVELLPFTPAAVHASCGQLHVYGAACEGCPPVAEARKAAAKLGKTSGAFLAASAQEKLELKERPRARTVLTNRWNALTERYSRTLNAVGRQAPGASASANQRLEELSLGFNSANTSGDLVAQDQAIRTAEETLRVFLRAARLARPDDCEYQRRLTDSF